jgi:hypothetical protein
VALCHGNGTAYRAHGAFRSRSCYAWALRWAGEIPSIDAVSQIAGLRFASPAVAGEQKKTNTTVDALPVPSNTARGPYGAHRGDTSTDDRLTAWLRASHANPVRAAAVIALDMRGLSVATALDGGRAPLKLAPRQDHVLGAFDNELSR